MTKKDLITLILGCFAVLSIIWSNRSGTEKLESAITLKNLEVLRQIDSSKHLIASFQQENRNLHGNLVQLVKARQDLQLVQQQITKQYKSLYEKINDTADTLQLSITESLLSKHRGLKLERN